jgi:RNA polymerase sigma factor (sigma-70 family)
VSVQTSLETTPRFGTRARPRSRRRLPRGRSDAALVARVRAGDDRAFELVFDRHHRGLLAFCGHMLGSREEAEDALQQTFMAAYRALRSTDGAIRLRAWLYTIARNHCLSVLRARREHVAFDETRAPTDGLAVELDRRAELRGLLGDLERLPDDQRAALVLFEAGTSAAGAGAAATAVGWAAAGRATRTSRRDSGRRAISACPPAATSRRACRGAGNPTAPPRPTPS